jgi:hypothetical protein
MRLLPDLRTNSIAVPERNEQQRLGNLGSRCRAKVLWLENRRLAEVRVGHGRDVRGMVLYDLPLWIFN